MEKFIPGSQRKRKIRDWEGCLMIHPVKKKKNTHSHTLHLLCGLNRHNSPENKMTRIRYLYDTLVLFLLGWRCASPLCKGTPCRTGLLYTTKGQSVVEVYTRYMIIKVSPNRMLCQFHPTIISHPHDGFLHVCRCHFVLGCVAVWIPPQFKTMCTFIATRHECWSHMGYDFFLSFFGGGARRLKRTRFNRK